MKKNIFKQLTIIFGMLFIGDFICKTFNLVIPGNVLGMILMLVSLLTGIVKIEDVEEVANFFLDNLAFFFVPGTVSLMAYMDILRVSGIQILIICVISTALVMGVSGRITQFIIRMKEGDLR